MLYFERQCVVPMVIPLAIGTNAFFILLEKDGEDIDEY